MSDQYKVALARAILTCLATGGLTCLTTYQMTHQWMSSLVAGGVALCTVVLARFGVEGSVDTMRAAKP